MCAAVAAAGSIVQLQQPLSDVVVVLVLQQNLLGQLGSSCGFYRAAAAAPARCCPCCCAAAACCCAAVQSEITIVQLQQLVVQLFWSTDSNCFLLHSHVIFVLSPAQFAEEEQLY